MPPLNDSDFVHTPAPKDWQRDKSIRTKCRCGADHFDPAPLHTAECRARRDVQDAVVDGIDAVMRSAFTPLSIGMRLIEWLPLWWRQRGR